MTPSSTYVSRYDRRINLVVEALRENPEPTEAAMSDDTARRVAARVLYALDHIPETVR